ncbi:MAG TPA: catalase [Burkholderiaceae bacterium]|nr:catalase [Burkholderiaceae bacterium]
MKQARPVFAHPSTDWCEHIAPDEATRFAEYADYFATLQRQKSAVHGQGRALHRKQLLAASGELEVLGNLPEFAAQGLFAQPGRYPVQVRLSNGGMDKAADRRPDIRGFSFAVLGVKGDSALGNGPATRQCFALINHATFAFANSAQFVGFALAAARGFRPLLMFMGKTFGWLALGWRMGQLMRTMNKPFASFATETFYSAAPIACGRYAVRVRLVPAPGNGQSAEALAEAAAQARKTQGKAAPLPEPVADWGADMTARLAQGPLVYDLDLQYFANAGATPIEDASLDWPTPYTTVARLTLPQQDLTSEAAQALAAEVEAGVFDPWAALAAHRPLGDVMRARKVVYFESQKGRGAA